MLQIRRGFIKKINNKFGLVEDIDSGEIFEFKCYYFDEKSNRAKGYLLPIDKGQYCEFWTFKNMLEIISVSYNGDNNLIPVTTNTYFEYQKSS